MGKIDILLVEDDMALKKAMSYTLKKEGFNVVEAENAEQCRKYFNDEIQLILLDISLPDGNGYDLCSEIRNKSDVPIIFITAFDDEANAVLGLDIGGDDYITKPIRIKELISRINAVLRRKGIEKKTEEIIEKHNIKVNLLKCTVYKDDKIINLTAAEYKLLLILMKNDGITLSREVILQKLWDINGDFVDGNTLSVYIKRLRGKLGNPKYIETVRGIGYKWV